MGWKGVKVWVMASKADSDHSDPIVEPVLLDTDTMADYFDRFHPNEYCFTVVPARKGGYDA